MSQGFVGNEKVMIIGSGPCSSGLAAAAALAMDGRSILYHPEGHIPFDPPLSRLPAEPNDEKTAGDRDRLIKAVEKRERKRVKALRNLGR